MLYIPNSTISLSDANLSGDGEVPGHCSLMASTDAAMGRKRPWGRWKGQLPTGPPLTAMRRESTFFLLHGNGSQGSSRGFPGRLRDDPHHYHVGSQMFEGWSSLPHGIPDVWKMILITTTWDPGCLEDDPHHYHVRMKYWIPTDSSWYHPDKKMLHMVCYRWQESDSPLSPGWSGVTGCGQFLVFADIGYCLKGFVFKSLFENFIHVFWSYQPPIPPHSPLNFMFSFENSLSPVLSLCAWVQDHLWERECPAEVLWSKLTLPTPEDFNCQNSDWPTWLHFKIKNQNKLIPIFCKIDFDQVLTHVLDFDLFHTTPCTLLMCRALNELLLSSKGGFPDEGWEPL